MKQAQKLITGLLVLIAVITFLVLGIKQPAEAQFPQGQPPQLPSGQGQFPGRMQPPSNAAAMAVSGNSVYIMRGNTLYQFSSDLNLVKKVTLAADQPRSDNFSPNNMP